MKILFVLMLGFLATGCSHQGHVVGPNHLGVCTSFHMELERGNLNCMKSYPGVEVSLDWDL